VSVRTVPALPFGPLRHFCESGAFFAAFTPRGAICAKKPDKAKIEPKARPVVNFSPRAFFCPFPI
jgi:hypothetical protein